MRYAILFMVLGMVGCAKPTIFDTPMSTVQCVNAIHDEHWEAVKLDTHCVLLSGMIARKYLLANPDFMNAANEAKP